MSCKKPILMAIDGVSRELVEEAECGSYVEPENPEQYNTIIRQYLSDKARLKQEGENGYLYAKKNFDRALLAEKYFNFIYKKVISSNHRIIPAGILLFQVLGFPEALPLIA